MKLQTIGIFLDKVSGPLLDHFLKKRIGLTEAQIERDLAQKYGEIAKHMAENAGEVVKPETKSIEVGYCLECLQRHYGKAHGLLEEAERFSLKEGKLTSDAAQKVRKAVEELVTSEDDLDSTQAPEGVRKKLNEIKDKMRDIRKTAWGRNLSFEGASLDALKEMKTGVDELSKRTYNVMGLDKRRFLLSSDGCPSCEMLKRQLAGEIKSGKIIVIDISSDRNFHLAKKLGIEAAPEIVTVSRNSDDTFSVQREDGRTYKLNSWSWWKKPKGGGPRSTSSTRK